MPLPTVGRNLGRRSRRMCKGVHGMRVCLTRLVLHLAFTCGYHICFALMGF